MTLPLSLANTTSIQDVPEWMFKLARERPGMYTIRVNMPKTWHCPCESASSQKKVEVKFSGEEFAKLDKVIMNQTYAESKPKVMSAIVFQHASVIWPSHTPDDVTMRTLGAWAITQYRANGTWFKSVYECLPFLALCCHYTQKQVDLDLNQNVGETRVAACGVIIFDDRKRILCGVEPPGKPRAGILALPCGKKDPGESDIETAVRETKEEARVKIDPEKIRLYKTFRFGRYDCRLFATINTDTTTWASHDDNLLSLKFRTVEEIKAFGEDGIAEAIKQCFDGDKFDPKIFEMTGPVFFVNNTAPEQETMGGSSSGTEGPPRNDLGYVEPGHGNADIHPLGGNDADDSEIRALREDRILVNEAGAGVIGQSTNPTNSKQIVGVLSLPLTDDPNVYAKEADNIESAIDNRITKKQRPFTATVEDRGLVGRLVAAALGNNPRRAVFSMRKVVSWWEKHLLNDLRSGKWAESRLSQTVEGLCRRIDPSFKLSCDIKLEPMPEGKAPRMLIADGDEGQVMALLVICCIEDLIKQHMPKKTIKGLGKRPAMERLAAELRVPASAFSKTKGKTCGQHTGYSKPVPPGVSVFEGDGSAWDTTCSAKLRDIVENPVIMHVGSILKVLMSEPTSWVDAHYDVCSLEKLAMTFKKNNEFRKLLIDAIRRSGHRGTSPLNWWDNFVGWHVCVFKQPEIFLDPDVRYGEDHSGIWRWLASGFEGDDSILSTTPKIQESDEIYVSILQRWERLGFNMKIFLRTTRALFTGYYMALDDSGPTGVMMPEVDRCFARAGISCSPKMIEYFKAGNRVGCQSVSRAAALSRAYEFAGWAPTISSKYLRYYESLGGSTHIDRDLMMRTTGATTDFSEPDILSEINVKNGAALSFDTSELDRLEATGFACTQEELITFSTKIWDYDLLKDWEGFRQSLPSSWRSA
jgi:8-oxo-dGTP pyrophosphatase MutT (NUDIX family)